MNRLGISSEDSSKVGAIFKMKYITVSGIFTHLCCSDSLSNDDVAFTNQQINNFYKLIDVLKDSGIRIPKLHIQSSYGLLNYPNLECDYVRVGIALYGVLSSPNDDTKLKLDLRPVLSLKVRWCLYDKFQRAKVSDTAETLQRSVTAKLPSCPSDMLTDFQEICPAKRWCPNQSLLCTYYWEYLYGPACS